MKNRFRSFESARKFVQSLNLKSQKDWKKYVKSNNKPDDIPSAPNYIYKNKGWISFGDWVGTGTVWTGYRKFLSFKDARTFVHSLNLKNNKDWKKYCKSDKKPKDIPAVPEQVYKNKGWKGVGDWINYARNYKSFEDARKFVHSLGIKGNVEWRNYCTSGNKPDDIPSAPNSIYKNKGWKSFGDWLGTGRIANRYKTYLSFEKARKFVQSLNLKSQKDWSEYRKSGNKPDDIPSLPSDIYKNKGWISWGDWLGTGRIADQYKVFKTFEEARKFVRSLGLKTKNEWDDYCKSGNKPDDIPSAPWAAYSKKRKK